MVVQQKNFLRGENSMARCPKCNKFVSFGEMDGEVQSVDWYGESVNVVARVMLPCCECGEELKEQEIEVETEVICPNCKSAGCFHEDDYEDSMPIIKESIKKGKKYIIDEDTKYFKAGDEILEYNDTEEPEAYERFGDVNPNGKIVNLKKHYYGVNIWSHMHCKLCGHDFDVNSKCEILASEMENIN